MPIRAEHELHRRRLGRNVGLGIALGAFVALVFGLTVVKLAGGGVIEGFDHGLRPGLAAPAEPAR